MFYILVAFFPCILTILTQYSGVFNIAEDQVAL